MQQKHTWDGNQPKAWMRIGSYGGVVPVTTNRIMHGLRPILNAPGTQTREYIWAGDIARGACDVAEFELGRCEFNLASRKPVSVVEIISKIVEIMNWKGGIEEGPARPGDVMRMETISNAAETYLGWKPTKSLDEALRETVEWFNATQPR